MAQEETQKITDLEALKVFTHPLRVKLYRALHASGPATASHLADQVDEAVSLVSYHLRKMAVHHFIVEVLDDNSDGRERWWKVSTERRLTFRNSDFADRPEGVAVLNDVTRTLLDERGERYRAWLEHQTAWPQEWSEASFHSDHQLRLTAAELTQMDEDLGELLQRWEERGRRADRAGDTEGREHVAVHLYGFPFRP